MGSVVENGTPRTRQSPGNTRTDTFRPWTSTLSSTQGTSPTTGQFSTLPKTLTFRPTLIQSAFPSQRNCLTSRHASPQDGERISSELLAITRLFSRRLTCQLLATTSARHPSGPPDLARGSSLTTLSSALAELMARTLAREMEAALWSARASSTWMNGELNRLSQEVTDMQNAGNLTGRKKAAALAKGIKAQETLNKYAQCNVLWQPIDAAPLTTGGNGYVDGGDVDVSNFERDNYPAAP